MKIKSLFLLIFPLVFSNSLLSAEEYREKSLVRLQHLSTSNYLDAYKGARQDPRMRWVDVSQGHGEDSQKWTLVPVEDDTYTFKNLATGQRLNSNSQGLVYTLETNGGYHQQWTLIPSGNDGVYTLKNFAIPKFLDSDGERVYALEGNNEASQKWCIEFIK